MFCFIIFRYEMCFWEVAFSLRNWSQPKKKKPLEDIKWPPRKKERLVLISCGAQHLQNEPEKETWQRLSL